MLCSECKKNIAVIYLNKIIDGKIDTEGLCIPCAKKQGFDPMNQMFNQGNLNPEDFENINEQLKEVFGDIDFNQIGNLLQNAENVDIDNLSKLFNSNSDDEVISEFDENIEESIDENISDDHKNAEKPGVKTILKKTQKKKKVLDTYGINLNDSSRNNKIDRVIGREKEIERVIQILNRRAKNNPVLIGEPGVGKTAIAEGLAVRITEKKVPAKLLNTEIYLLDLTAIVAGTQFRGQFESRMKSIIDEAKKLGNIILVIDELHNIMGAGEAEGGTMNAANILKPALARGEIQIIGATTLDEYRKHIEKDTALERRFQSIIVDEPSIADTIEIIKGIKDYYEDFHKVKISDEIIESAVSMSERYITDRFLPDKAIDVIDEAGSRANLNNLKLAELEGLITELMKVKVEKENAAQEDNYQKAAECRMNELRLEGTINFLKRECDEIYITQDDIAHVIEAWTKIPVQRITEVEAEKLLNLESRIHNRLVGQNKAVESLSRAIRRNRSGFKKKKKPSSFIFVGPTGVGKTELAKTLAFELFSNEDAMIRLDMSEFMEQHTVSKLIGAPPGYVGYDQAGYLTEKIRRNPYSVILLDEIEKAHSDIFNILLQILEDGRLTDSKGRTVSFENAVIIMTSNVGTSAKGNKIGFGSDSYEALESMVTDELKKTFRPEFLNRVDEVVVFSELNLEEQKMIIDLMINEVIKDAGNRKIEISVSEEVKKYILETGYDPKYGARPLRRTIEKVIENSLSEEFLKGNVKENMKLNYIMEDNKVKITVENNIEK